MREWICVVRPQCLYIIISKLWRHQYAGIESWEITDDILYFICGKHVLHVSARLFFIAPF